MVKNLKENALSIWWRASSTLHEEGVEVSLAEKLKNERKIEASRKQISKILNQKPAGKDEEKIWLEKLISQVKEIEPTLSHYDFSMVDFFINIGYLNSTNDFINRAKQFDSKINETNIFQAMRNVWIMNSIQILFDLQVEITPSIFAYSMLYPYSDNYLDDPSISSKDKMEFSERFRKWIIGENAQPINIMEENIQKLVFMIVEEYDRSEYPQVFESLLAIHRAQEQSLIQQKEKTVPYEKDIIGISFEKGGTSVLADAYLVRGNLSTEEAKFMFNYGVLLQIIDDLQDVEEDFNSFHMTILSQLENKFKLDPLINKLFDFIKILFINENCFKSEKAILLKRIIIDSSNILINEAVSKNTSRFSKKYVNALERKSKVRFSYLRKMKKKFAAFTVPSTVPGTLTK